VTFNFVDAIRDHQTWIVRAFGKDATYKLHEGATATLRVVIRRVRADDLFASAMQQDVAAVFNAADFIAAFPSRKTPARLDRIVNPNGRSYTIEEVGGAQEIEPVHFKCLVRGGQQ
jgi:hypothetical protein